MNRGTALAELFRRLIESSEPGLAASADLSHETWRHSLRMSLAGWRDDLIGAGDLSCRVGREPGLVILPANTPAPLLNVTAAACIAGRPVLLRPSRRRCRFAEEWLENCAGIAGLDLRLAQEIDLSRTPRVAVFGSDETIASVRAEVGRDADFLGFGHRFSVAWVEDPGPDLAAGIARDVVAWNQLGCLSPQVVFVRRPGGAALAEALAQEMERIDAQCPRGAVPPGVSLAIRIARAEHAAAGATLRGPDTATSWTVSFFREAQFRFSPLYRSIVLSEVDGWSEALAAIGPHRAHLEAVGVANTTCNLEGIEPWQLAPIGAMQSPPLRRRHGGLTPLVDWL